MKLKRKLWLKAEIIKTNIYETTTINDCCRHSLASIISGSNKVK